MVAVAARRGGSGGRCEPCGSGGVMSAAAASRGVRASGAYYVRTAAAAVSRDSYLAVALLRGVGRSASGNAVV